MATGACSTCDYSPVASDARTCPRCGSADPNPSAANRYATRGVFLGLAAGSLVGGGLGSQFIGEGGGGGAICGVLLGAIPGLCAGLALGLVLSLVLKGEAPRRPARRRPADDDLGLDAPVMLTQTPPAPAVTVKMGRKTATVTVPRSHPLPMVCASCGDPATGHHDKTHSWTPAWSLPLLLAGLHVSRSVTLSLPVCGCRARRHWRAAKAFAAGLAAATAIGAYGYYGASATDPALGEQVVIAAAFLAVAVGTGALMLTVDPVGVGRVDDFGVTLTHVSHEFARALEPRRARRAGDPPAGADLVTARYFRP